MQQLQGQHCSALSLTGTGDSWRATCLLPKYCFACSVQPRSTMMPASLLILVVQGEKTEAPGHQNFPELTYPVAELGADLTQCDSTPVAHEVVPHCHSLRTVGILFWFFETGFSHCVVLASNSQRQPCLCSRVLGHKVCATTSSCESVNVMESKLI